ncbi:FAD-dependent thymidylate synthase, partial [Flavobacterium sp.]|uniref:FAD-dependent thymidylate synthase n=1 Tax=Flavobacterium sp. TaxID=239 RepID=UPI0033429F96
TLYIYGQEACNLIEYSVKYFCKYAYKNLINLVVIKEQDRTILPLNLNTTMIWTGSLYSLIRLCKQRLKPDAQQETREVVQLMLDQLKEKQVFNQSLKVYELL